MMKQRAYHFGRFGPEDAPLLKAAILTATLCVWLPSVDVRTAATLGPPRSMALYQDKPAATAPFSAPLSNHSGGGAWLWLPAWLVANAAFGIAIAWAWVSASPA